MMKQSRMSKFVLLLFPVALTLATGTSHKINTRYWTSLPPR